MHSGSSRFESWLAYRLCWLTFVASSSPSTGCLPNATFQIVPCPSAINWYSYSIVKSSTALLIVSFSCHIVLLLRHRMAWSVDRQTLQLFCFRQVPASNLGPADRDPWMQFFSFLCSRKIPESVESATTILIPYSWSFLLAFYCMRWRKRRWIKRAVSLSRRAAPANWQFGHRYTELLPVVQGVS